MMWCIQGAHECPDRHPAITRDQGNPNVMQHCGKRACRDRGKGTLEDVPPHFR